MPDIDPQLAKMEAERRIRRAMDHVERAQRELEAACQDLCDITGGAPLWSAVGKVGDRVHAMWQKLARFVEAGRFDLGDVGRAAFAKRIAGEDRHA